MSIIRLYAVIVFTVVFLIGCTGEIKKSNKPDSNTTVIDKTPDKLVDKNDTIEQLSSVESKYLLDKNGNILDKNGNILDTNARLDKNNNIIDKDGQTIDKQGNLLSSSGAIIGVYIPPKRSKLISALVDSGFDVSKHQPMNIAIDGVSYTINATLVTSTGRKIGIGESVKNNFFGNQESKGFVFSPLEYVSVIQDDQDIEVLLKEYSALHAVSIVLKISNNFSFANNNVVYKSPPGTKECISDTQRSLIFSLYLNAKNIGYFQLKCDNSSGEMSSIVNTTKFSDIYDDVFFVKIAGEDKEYSISTRAKCDNIELDSGVPPLPNLCIMKNLN